MKYTKVRVLSRSTVLFMNKTHKVINIYCSNANETEIQQMILKLSKIKK